MAEIEQFAYGWINPVVSYVIAAFGCAIGLICTARAREARAGAHREKWLVLGALAIGGTGIWPMHFIAMLGFDVPGSIVRYDVSLTTASALIAVLAVGIGLFIVGHGQASLLRIMLGGIFAGLGVAAMHYTGMAAMRVGGSIAYDPVVFTASVLIAVVASAVALWFTVNVRGWGPIVVAALIMGVAVVGMHYTAMFGVEVHLHRIDGPVDGVNPFLLVAPITLLVSCALVGLIFSVLAPPAEDEADIVAGLSPLSDLPPERAGALLPRRVARSTPPASRPLARPAASPRPAPSRPLRTP
ncbi:MHYT domain-containing protein [Longispora albida]|uniref:MHYT domain-containing protein n=1 Tax=Longispora albida TaxID=203523 RepID=UPI00036A3815|nr:MHYT domain-containing protein [Longispora albida]